MAKLTDTQKDEVNDSFVSFVIAKMICKDPWGRFVRCVSLKLAQCSCMCHSKKEKRPLISALTDEPPVLRGGDTDSFVSARVRD